MANLNIFDRLRNGVKLETLSERDCEIINELNATGNEMIVLTSETADIGEQIEHAIPFTFCVAVNDGMTVLNVFPDAPPNCCTEINPSHREGFGLTHDVQLRWI